jgi:hypothetical protein
MFVLFPELISVSIRNAQRFEQDRSPLRLALPHSVDPYMLTFRHLSWKRKQNTRVNVLCTVWTSCRSTFV